MNYFQGNKNHASAISVGAVLINKQWEICVHHFTGEEKGYWIDEGLTDFYLLMRNTLQPNETLEKSLARGLLEEFGATTIIKDYIGSIQSHWKHDEVEVEKTTLYFLCELESVDESKRRNSIESQTKLEWHPR